MRADMLDLVRARLAELKDGAPGERGLPGEPGEPGKKGDVGEKGEKGEKGEAGQAGVSGAQGEAGSQGEVGPQGEPGQAGEPGTIGPQGVPGERGLPGEPGGIGPVGGQGERGLQGEKGLPGERGEAGLAGKDGAPGKLPPVKAWAEGVHYICEVCAYLGATWQAQKDTANAPPHADWVQLAAAGKDAVSPTIRGTYASDGKYKRFDIVALNGSSFIARADEPGECPGAGWQLIASAGRPGKPGLKGEPGERGDAGPAGKSGQPAPTIVGWIIDRTNYSVTPVMSDAKPAPAVELRELFEQFQIEAK